MLLGGRSAGDLLSGEVRRAVLVGALVVVGMPLAVDVLFAHPPPLGIYLNGAVIGALYGLIAIGLILVYRANRIINFAQAGLGSVPAAAALLLYSQRGLPYPLALVVMVVASLVLGAVVDVAVVRRFRRAPRLILTVATIGVSQILAFLELFTPKWVSGTVRPPTGFATPLTHHRALIGGVYFTGDHLFAVVTVVALTAGLALFLGRTRIGMAVRAIAENGERAQLLGIPANRVTLVVWMLAALLSAAGVFLRIPLVGFPMGSLIGPTVLLYALAAAVIARMRSLPLALCAGIAIGAFDQSSFYATRRSDVSAALMLPVILIALVLNQRALSRADDTGVATWQAVKEFRGVPPELRSVREVVLARTAVVVLAAAVGIALPFLVGPVRRNSASLLLIYAMIAISLVVLTGWAGQISLGQFALAGIGAAVAGGLAANHHTDFFVTLVAAGVVGAGVAAVVGIPALRVQGLFLAVATLAFAANGNSFFLNSQYFGWLLPKSGREVLRPVVYGRIDVASDIRFYYVCLAALGLAVFVARSLRASRSGRVFIAARDNPRAAQALGLSLARTRLVAFAAAGFLAGLAGALFAYLQGAVDAGAFTPTMSVQVFAMAVIGGLTSVAGAVLGAAYVVGFQYLLSDYQLLATGAGMLLLLMFFPGGLAEVAFRLRDAFLRWVAARHQLHVPSLVADRRVETGPVAEAEVAGAAMTTARPARAESVQCGACLAWVPVEEIAGHPCIAAATGAPRPGPEVGNPVP